ncbi:hypothetical protein BDZ45DRAFT_802464 [Acephala macrosclerotiorum]|nr:hypothetical protein BDZ45DRAFT_802464 [Acephala macrosclerotiorum]
MTLSMLSSFDQPCLLTFKRQTISNSLTFTIISAVRVLMFGPRLPSKPFKRNVLPQPSTKHSPPRTLTLHKTAPLLRHITPIIYAPLAVRSTLPQDPKRAGS